MNLTAQMKHTFTIAGCQRSGTTLMRLMLESHPYIAVFDETKSYSYLAEMGRAVDATRNGFRHVGPGWEAMPEELQVAYAEHDLVGFKIPRLTEQLHLETIYDQDLLEADGMPIGKFLNPFLGHALSLKHIFMLRNPLDTVASMLRWRMHDGQSWLRRWGVPTLLRSTAPDVRRRIIKAMQAAPGNVDADALFGAIFWCEKNRHVIATAESAESEILIVRYEDLVMAPEETMRSVLGFLGVAWDDKVLYHHLIKHGEIIGEAQFPVTDDLHKGLTVGGTNPKRAVDSSSVGEFTKVLTPDQISLISGICSSMEDSLQQISPVKYAPVDFEI